jgi:SAM-dependent methyltransferase
VIAAYHRFLQEVSEEAPTEPPHSVRPAAATLATSALEAEPLAAELPIPPLEMRTLIGQLNVEAFDNPSRAPVFDFVDPAVFRSVFEFRCGCGRLARQMIQQVPQPERYVGIDPHRGMIAWCKRNLAPAADGFEFVHHDVYDYQLNRSFGKPRMLPFPVEDHAFSLVEAWAVFPHLTEDQAVFYLREVARILAPGGVFHSTWFLFDKCDGFPMLHEAQNALYASDVDPAAAVAFDRAWLRRQAASLGLLISGVWPVHPAPRGFQWHILMTQGDAGPAEVAWPVDDRPPSLA